MKDIITTTAALKALVTLGYPLELSRVKDYLANLPDSKEKLIQFEDEESLCTFLRKYPAMFWVEEGEVYPAQMKPKVGSGSRIQSEQSHPQGQPGTESDSNNEERQQDEKMGEEGELVGVDHKKTQPEDAGVSLELDREENRAFNDHRSEDDTHDTAKLLQECIKAIKAALEEKGPLHLTALISHLPNCPPKISSFFQRNIKGFLQQHPKIFVIDKHGMVYLVSAIQQEGCQHFKKVLEQKGSLHIKNLCGHCSHYKYVDAMLKVIGGSPSSVMDFLKAFPEVFNVDDRGMVYLTAFIPMQLQKNKPSGEDNKAKRTKQKEVCSKDGQMVNDEEGNNKGKTDATQEQLEKQAVLHFTEVLRTKGSLPLTRIHGYLGDCPEQVRKATPTGSGPMKIKELFSRYPKSFAIDTNNVVHLKTSPTAELFDSNLSVMPLASQSSSSATTKRNSGDGDLTTSAASDSGISTKDRDTGDVSSGDGGLTRSAASDAGISTKDRDTGDVSSGDGDLTRSAASDAGISTKDRDTGDVSSGDGDLTTTTSAASDSRISTKDKDTGDVSSGDGDLTTSAASDSGISAKDRDTGDVSNGDGDLTTSAASDSGISTRDRDTGDVSNGDGDLTRSASSDSGISAKDRDTGDVSSGDGDLTRSAASDSGISTKDRDTGDVSSGDGDLTRSAASDSGISTKDRDTDDVSSGDGDLTRSAASDAGISTKDRDTGDVSSGDGDLTTSAASDLGISTKDRGTGDVSSGDGDLTTSAASDSGISTKDRDTGDVSSGDGDLTTSAASDSGISTKDRDTGDVSSGDGDLTRSAASDSGISTKDRDTGDVRVAGDVTVPSPMTQSSVSKEDCSAVESKAQGEAKQTVDAPLEEGAAHIVKVLEEKVSMPLGRLHGHVNQCREEVRKAIGGGPERAREFFMKFPAYFHIDAADNVHLTGRIRKDSIKALSAILEREGPIHLNSLLRFVHRSQPEVRSFVGEDKESVIAFLIKHPNLFFIDDNDAVYHFSTAYKEAVRQLKLALQSRGKLHVNELASQIKKFRHKVAILWFVGDRPSSIEEFLKGYPDIFGVDDNGVMQLTDAQSKQFAIDSASSSSGKTKTTKNMTEVEAEVSKKKSKDQSINKRTKLLQEGVKYFKDILQEKGQLPIERLYEHVTQCSNEVKGVIGIRFGEVERFLQNYPEVFTISRRGNVHLVCAEVKEKQRNQDKQMAARSTSDVLSTKPRTGDELRKSTSNQLLSTKSKTNDDLRKSTSNLTLSAKAKAQYELRKSTSNLMSCNGPKAKDDLRKSTSNLTISTKPKTKDDFRQSTSNLMLNAKPKVNNEEVRDRSSQQAQHNCEDKNETTNGTSGSRPCAKEHGQSQKLYSSSPTSDKYVTAIKGIMSENGSLHLADLAEELMFMFPNKAFQLSEVKLFLKKFPDIFHVNNQDVVEEVPPVNALAMINVVQSTTCFATLEDGSRMFVPIELYIERMGVDCTRLDDHLSPGDLLLVDTQEGKIGSSLKWTAKNIIAVFKSCHHASKHGVNLQTPLPFLPAATMTRSPSEIHDAIVKLVVLFLKTTSPLQMDVLRKRMKYLNHDAVLYLRKQGGLLQFLQSRPQMFHVQDGNVTLVSMRGQSLEAKCTIGEVRVISNNTAHLLLPNGKKAMLNLTDVQGSINTSCLRVGDSVVAYVMPSPDQGKIPWVVSKVKHVIGKASPAQVHAKTATATFGSPLLKDVLQQCVQEEEVNTVLAWHKHLSKKTKLAFEDLAKCLQNLPKQVQQYTLQKGDPHKILEEYPSLFYVDNVGSEVSLAECSPGNRAVFFGGTQPVETHPVQTEGSAQPVMLKPDVVLDNSLSSVAAIDQAAVEFFRNRIMENGQLSLQVLSTCFGSCPTAIRHHVGSSQKGLAKFFRNHPDTFSLDEYGMMCTLKDKVKTENSKQQKKTDQTEQKAVAYFKTMLSKKGPLDIHALSSDFGNCGEDIRRHVKSSKAGLTKFLLDHPETFVVGANEVVHLNKAPSDSSPSFPPSKDAPALEHQQQLGSMQHVTEDQNGQKNTLVLTDTVMVQHSLHGLTTDRLSSGQELHRQEQASLDSSALTTEAMYPITLTSDSCNVLHSSGSSDHVTNDRINVPDASGDSNTIVNNDSISVLDPSGDSTTYVSNGISDKYFGVVKDLISEKGSLHLVQLVEELKTMCPHEGLDLHGVLLFLKKHPDIFHVNKQDVIKEVPPLNTLAMVEMVRASSCFATLEDASTVYIHIALYRERMGVDCIRLKDHLSPGDILLVDTEHNVLGNSAKWTAINIASVFKFSHDINTGKQGVNLQTPMSFLPSSTTTRSPSEICDAIVKLLTLFFKESSSLKLEELNLKVKYLNHDARLFLIEKGGLLPFLQSQPQMFQIQKGNVTLVLGKGQPYVSPSHYESEQAKCAVGEITTIASNKACLLLPTGNEAILNFTDVQDSINTSCLKVGDSIVVYIVPSHDQCETPWVVSKVKHVLGKAIPAQLHAERATTAYGQVAQKAVAYFKTLLAKKGPLDIHALSSDFGNCGEDIRRHVKSSKAGLTKFLLDHPGTFVVDAKELVHLNCTSSDCSPSFPPSKHALEQHQQSASIQPVKEGQKDGGKGKKTLDHTENATDQSSFNLQSGSAQSQDENELATNVPTEINILSMEDALHSSVHHSSKPQVLSDSKVQNIEGQEHKDQAKSPQEPDEEGDQTDVEKETEPDSLTTSASGYQLQPTESAMEQAVGNADSPVDKPSVHVGICGVESNQESSTVPTATVHPMTLTSGCSNVPNKSASSDSVDSVVGHGGDSESTSSAALQTVDNGTVIQASHTSTAVDTITLPPSSVESLSDPSQLRPAIEESTPVGSQPGLLQRRPSHLQEGEDETLDASPPGQPDDFTPLLPMFKDNLSPILDNLVEVEMDLGRIPIARYYNPESPGFLAATKLSSETLTRETLETILFALPLERADIGQGRVHLKGSLHWVSTLKNAMGEVVGLTLRKGQAVYGCVDILWDVVTSGTSTLIIGRPCSGKTTLLREWARVLSDCCNRRVIVVDTLNEIAGGDDIPHSGVGGARRFQVHNRCDQLSQLQTAARNHSPDCIIVDEVQTQAEVAALQAIRLTGIQVVAGVCASSMTDLLHHRVMRELLGVSDPTSSPTLTFPQSMPVFQVAVEVHNRDHVSVHCDVAAFVRASFEGRFLLGHHRKRVVTKDRWTPP